MDGGGIGRVGWRGARESGEWGGGGGLGSGEPDINSRISVSSFRCFKDNPLDGGDNWQIAAPLDGRGG
jgi:hypothetical protein